GRCTYARARTLGLLAPRRALVHRGHLRTHRGQDARNTGTPLAVLRPRLAGAAHAHQRAGFSATTRTPLALRRLAHRSGRGRSLLRPRGPQRPRPRRAPYATDETLFVKGKCLRLCAKREGSDAA